MSFTHASFYSQKKGTLYSLALMSAVLVLVVGILSVGGAKFSTDAQTFTPKWVQASSTHDSLNITISNDATSLAAIKRVDITPPGDVTILNCGPKGVTSWTCTKSAVPLYLSFTTAGSGIAAGSSLPFNINITAPATEGNQSFTIDTYESAGGVNQNTSYVNVSVDSAAPSVKLLNISTSVKNISSSADFNSFTHIFLNNASAGIVVAVQVTDSGAGVGNVTLTYNYTQDINAVVMQAPVYNNNSGDLNTGANITAVPMANSSASPTIFTYTIPTSNFYNGSRLFFSILANDTVGNGNISNKTASTGYNFTIDAAAPIISRMLITNWSSVNTSAFNTTSTSRNGLEYIMNSTVPINVTALVGDDGGSGAVKAEIRYRTGSYLLMNLSNGTNGSAITGWSYLSSNLTEVVNSFAGDGIYNVSIRVTDNVSNVRYTNFTVEVDDSPPKGIVLSTIINTTVANATTDVYLLNSSVYLSVLADNNPRSITATGNKGTALALAQWTGSTATTSTWNVTIANGTVGNLSVVCDVTGTDGSQCNINFAIKDVLDRTNSSLNVTLFIDAAAPTVTIRSPVTVTKNYSTTALINISVEDIVGPVQSATFKWMNETHNGSLTPLTIGEGTNTVNNSHSSWSTTYAISALAEGNYSVEFNVTDDAGRRNTTVYVSNVIFDTTPSHNITINSPAQNSFNNANFTISIVANDSVAGLLNVSFRVENNTHTWPWVASNQVVSAFGTQTFNSSEFNMTHFGGLTSNATNGNFTMRFNVTDTAGNQNTTVTINFTIDTVAPTVAFVSPLSNQNQTINFTINVTVSELNINLSQWRWVNDSSGSNFGGQKSRWQTLTRGTATTLNATFPYMELWNQSFLDGNYSIEVVIGDKAGNINTASVQLILDKNAPLIASPTLATLKDTNRTGDFVVNLTINDTNSWNENLGRINTTNIRGTSFRLENASYNGSWVTLVFPTTDITSTESNRSNATFTFSSVPNGLYDIRFNATDTSGNQNSSVLINNVRLDNVKPGVSISVANLTPAPSGGAGISGTLVFNVTITDNLPINISMPLNASVQNNKFGVFYRFESASANTAWLPMSTSFNTAEPHKLRFNASNITTTLADGDYTLRINATDSAGNQNTTVSVGISIQNGGTGLITVTHALQSGFFSGSLSNQSNPTFLVNTSVNATCRYALDRSDLTNWTLLGSARTMDNNVSRQHSVSLGSLSDKTTYNIRYVCRALDNGNFTSPNDGTTTTFPFGVDTRMYYNVTIGNKGSNNACPASPSSCAADEAGRGDYFTTGWHKFELPSVVLTETGVATTYNVTNVLTSLMQSTVAGNFSRVYAYNSSANSWKTFIPGTTSNTFINFTDGLTYWINITASDRLEIN